MAIEIEKRFLLVRRPPLAGIVPQAIRQGYLSRDPARTVRVRQKDQEAFLTIKGQRVQGRNPEFEYAIPAEDAAAMMALCGQSVLTKDRYPVPASNDLTWEIDLFTGRHAGLMIAELELSHEGQSFEHPSWLSGAYDITEDNRFSNASLVDMTSPELKALIEQYTPRAPAGLRP